ncbi:MAG: SIS domain-containing protein [Acidobacteria bacterium]|nr:SIS domain-containing protein [Acidobacteriota bacterium]
MSSARFSTDAYLAELTAALQALDRGAVERIAAALVDAQCAGRMVFICGNGGSAAVATHWAADLSKLTAVPGQPRLRVMCLTDSAAAITAAANDFDYQEVFTDQLRTFMGAGDVVIGISTSGRSPNVLRALEYAAAHGGLALGITGQSGDALKAVTSVTLVVASTSVQRVEDVAGIAAHLACLLARERVALRADAALSA